MVEDRAGPWPIDHEVVAGQRVGFPFIIDLSGLGTGTELGWLAPPVARPILCQPLGLKVEHRSGVPMSDSTFPIC